MANRIYGEARLTLDDRELTLRFDFGALVEAEEASGVGTQEMMKELAGGSGARLRTARAMLYGALRYHHPEITLEEAGDFLMSDGEAISDAMGRAMNEMAERRSPNPRKGAAAKPSKPPLGTSTRSSPHGAKAA